MKNTIGFLALALMSTSASAIEIDFEGVISDGGFFIGSFSFDLNNPDEVNTDELPQQLSTTYFNNSSSVVSVNLEGVNSSDNVFLDYTDNLVIGTSSKLAEFVDVGTYDLVLLAGDSEGATFSDDDILVNGTEFSLYTLLDQNTFNLVTDNLVTDDFPEFLKSIPAVTVFGIKKMNSGEVAFDIVDIANITVSAIPESAPVPAPTAVWLFGTAVAGLAIKRKRS